LAFELGLGFAEGFIAAFSFAQGAFGLRQFLALTVELSLGLTQLTLKLGFGCRFGR
jgi:hypothetical protein